MNNDLIQDIRLKWHIDYPNYEDCYVDGYGYGLIALDEQLNPYQSDSIEGQYWAEGWWSAFYDEKPLFHLDGVNIAKAQPRPYESKISQFLITFFELSGVLMVSSLLSYQLWELVA